MIYEGQIILVFPEYSHRPEYFLLIEKQKFLYKYID